VIQFNLSNNTGTDGTFTVLAHDGSNNTDTLSQAFTLAQGSNRAAAVTVGGTSVITSITITGSAALISEIAQVQITPHVAAVPEPATAVLMGGCFAGLGAFRALRRRQEGTPAGG
jgi:hypothetical protein